MEPFRIKSAHDGTTLEFCDPIRSAGGELDYFTVAIQAPNASAIAKIYAYQAESLVTFFTDVAQSWRGWDGVKEWTSLEGEFELRATSDRLGHVTLGYTLRSGHGQYDWCVTGAVELEAGQLERVAADAEGFIRATAV